MSDDLLLNDIDLGRFGIEHLLFQLDYTMWLAIEYDSHSGVDLVDFDGRQVAQDRKPQLRPLDLLAHGAPRRARADNKGDRGRNEHHLLRVHGTPLEKNRISPILTKILLSN